MFSVTSAFSQTLSGVATIRAYGQTQRFVVGLEAKVDANSAPTVVGLEASQWLSIRLDFLSAVVTFSVAALTALLTEFAPAANTSSGSSGSSAVLSTSAGYLALGVTCMT